MKKTCLLFFMLCLVAIYAQSPVQLVIQSGHSKEIRSVYFTPDNEWIFTASSDKTIKQYTRDGILMHSYKEIVGDYLQIQFLKSKKQALVFGTLQDSAYLIDFKERKVLKKINLVFKLGDNPINIDGAILQDDQNLLLFSANRESSSSITRFQVLRLSLSTGKFSVLCNNTYQGNDNVIFNKAVNRYIHVLYHDDTYKKYSIYLRDTTRSRIVKDFGKALEWSFSEDGKQVIVNELDANGDAVFRIYSALDGSLIKQVNPVVKLIQKSDLGYYLDDMILSPLNDMIVVTQKGRFGVDTYDFYDMNGNIIHQANKNKRDQVSAFTFNRNQTSYVVARGSSGENIPVNLDVYQYEGNSERLLNSIGDCSQVYSSAFSDDNKKIVLGMKDGAVVWDINGSLLNKTMIGSTSKVAYLNDQKGFLLGGDWQKVLMVDLNGNVQKEIVTEDFGNNVYLNKNLDRAIVVNHKFIELISLQTYKVIKRIDYEAYYNRASSFVSGVVWMKDRFMVLASRQIDVYSLNGDLLKSKEYPCCIIDEDKFFYSERENKVYTLAYGGPVNTFDADGNQLDRFDLQWPRTWNDDFYNVPTSIAGNDALGQFILGSTKGDIYIYGYDGKLVSKLANHKSQVDHLNFSNDGKYLLSGSRDGQLSLWNSKDNYSIAVHYYLFGEHDFVTVSPDGYYSAPKSSLGKLFFLKDGKLYRSENFDLKLNRPDIIMERIGCAESELIQLYKTAYQKRIKRVNVEESQLANAGFELQPEVRIPEIKTYFNKFKSNLFRFQVQASDSLSVLWKLFVSVNGNPHYGISGKDLRGESLKRMSIPVELELSEGKNLIEISVLNQKGIESLKESFEVLYSSPKEKKPDLYLITIGVSKFKDSKMNLTYSAKDADDLMQLFASKQKDAYGKVNTQSFLDKNATRENILTVKEFLKNTTVNDVVMVFVASHGILDEQLNYYVATYDMDFVKPSERGLSFEMLEGLLDGIPARRKTILLDACHAGELDRDDATIVNTQTLVEDGDIKFRSFGNAVVSKTGKGNSFELSKELFSDLKKSTGATVISSAGAMEYAIEGDKWKNGVFTYSFINGIKNGDADLNKDGSIMLSEIKLYIYKNVHELTNGKQKPTSRVENNLNDFRIW